jgi:hypothetical protein
VGTQQPDGRSPNTLARRDFAPRFGECVEPTDRVDDVALA